MTPTNPFSVTFSNVSYEVPVGGKGLSFQSQKSSKKILHNVSGDVSPGEFLAILGPSGAGKSTLLNLLAARSAHPPSSGTILFSGRPRVPRTKRYIGYVMQDDIFFSKLTVRETLTFAADIRLPHTMTHAQRQQRVDELISLFNLEKCQHTSIGGNFEKGISGGERKRLNVANEIIHNPSLLLADECTSGLDSSSAMTVLNVLDEFRKERRTVIVTIHQPSSRMFYMFSKILILAAGRVAYFGKPHNIISYFEALDFPFPSTAYNPADFVLEHVIDDHKMLGQEESPQQRLLTAWAESDDSQTVENSASTNSDRFENQDYYSENKFQEFPHHVTLPIEAPGATIGMKTLDSEIDEASQSDMEEAGKGFSSICEREPPVSQLGRFTRAFSKRVNNIAGIGVKSIVDDKYMTNWWAQVAALLRRAVKQKKGMLIRGTAIAQLISTTIILMVLWFRMEPRESRIEDRLGFISFLGIIWGYFSVTSTIFSFPEERSVLQKDRANGIYRLSAYYMAKTIVEIATDTLYPLSSCVVLYYAAGMNPDIRCFLLFCLIVTLNVLVSQSVGLFASALFMNVRQSLVFGSTWVLGSQILSGFALDPNNIPDRIKFIRHLSFLRYSYEALIKVEFLFGRVFACETDPTMSTIYSQNGKLCPIDESALSDAAQLQLLPIWMYILIQIIWIVSLRFLGYFALKTLHTTHKPKLSVWKST